jgi:hypothetical protein
MSVGNVTPTLSVIFFRSETKQPLLIQMPLTNTLWARIFLEKLILARLRAVNAVHVLTAFTFHIHFNIISHLHAGLPSSLLHSSFPTRSVWLFTFWFHATYPIKLILLHFITIIIFSDEHKLWRSSQCSFLHKYQEDTDSVMDVSCFLADTMLYPEDSTMDIKKTNLKLHWSVSTRQITLL